MLIKLPSLFFLKNIAMQNLTYNESSYFHFHISVWLGQSAWNGIFFTTFNIKLINQIKHFTIITDAVYP